MRVRLLSLLAVAAAILGAALPTGARAAVDERANVGITAGHTGFASGGSLERPPLRTRWTRSLGTYTGEPVVGGGRVYITASDDMHAGGTLFALDAATGATVWSRSIAGYAEIAYESSRLFVSEQSGAVSALSAATGATQWIRVLAAPYYLDTPVADGGTLYVSSAWSGGALWALDERDGSTRWLAPVDAGGAPALDGTYVYISDRYAGTTTAYARADGSVAWYGGLQCIAPSGTALADGARVVGPVDRGCGAVSDAASGRVLDSFSSSVAPAAAGDVAVTMSGATLQARSIHDSVLLWQFAGDGLLRSAPVVVNETVYVRSATGALFALDLRTGTQIWSGAVPPDPVTYNAPGIAAAAGILVVPASGTVTALESTRAPRPGLDLRIASGPDGPTTATSATLTFASAALGAPETCRLDGGPWLPCSGSATYPALAEGPHMFEARTHDLFDGSVVALAARGWSVDTTAPVATITQAPSGLTTAPTAYVGVASEDAAARVECRIDASAWVACPPRDGPTQYRLDDGPHTLAVRARDALGNVQSPPATRTWTVDSTPPRTTIETGPQGATTATAATFTFSATEDATFSCSMDWAPFAACNSPFAMSGVAERGHTLQVYATDPAGNRELQPVLRTWVVVPPSSDLTPPETQITAAPPSVTAATSARFEFTADESSWFECRLDGAFWVACSGRSDLTDLADGPHAFDVRATDAAGNLDPTPASWTWTVDTRPPQTQAALEPGPAPRFSFAADEPAATFECELDSGSWTPCASGVSYGALPAGAHLFAVRATDPAGNREMTGATVSFTSASATAAAPPSAGPRPTTAVTGLPSNSAPALARILAGETAALLRSSTRRALRTKPAVTFRASGPARLAVTVTAREHGRTFTFARADRTFAAAGTRRVRLRITGAGRRRLARPGQVVLRIRATVTPVAGAAASARATARI